MSRDLSTLPCPRCGEHQLNQDLLRVHLIRKHKLSVEEADRASSPFAKVLGEFEDLLGTMDPLGKYGRRGR
jgi:hypothetical protein